MALKITDAVERISSALASPASCTVGFWFRRSSQDLTNSPTISRFGSSASRVIEYAPTPRLALTGRVPDNVLSIAVGSWAYLAYVKSGNNLAVYGFTDVSSETLTTIVAAAYLPTTADAIEFGDVAGAYQAGFIDDELLDCRAWSSALTTAQLNTEKNTSTPVITSGLILSASFESALTASVGTNFAATVGSAYTFTANVPTSRGAAPSGVAARGAYYYSLRS